MMIGGSNKMTGVWLRPWLSTGTAGALAAVLAAMLGLAAVLPLAGCSSFGGEY